MATNNLPASRSLFEVAEDLRTSLNTLNRQLGQPEIPQASIPRLVPVTNKCRVIEIPPSPRSTEEYKQRNAETLVELWQMGETALAENFLLPTSFPDVHHLGKKPVPNPALLLTEFCEWESPETAPGRCDGGFPCHSKAVVNEIGSGTAYCLDHFEER